MDSHVTNIIIFGITGDLARRKLLPALLDLYLAGCLPNNFRIFGVARKRLTHMELRALICEAIATRGHEHDVDSIEAFASNAMYLAGNFDEPSTYGELSKLLAEEDKQSNSCSNKLFYLSVPPTLYDTIFQNLADSGLSIPCAGDGGWTRLAVEKPFGRDLESAVALEKKLSLLFREDQIFRIDHYLGKETLENILTFRFANSVFEPAWNHESIEKVHIKLLESKSVGSRGEFYEGTGALRDVGQNHLLQMLAFTAMNDPKVWEAEAIRKSRADVLARVRLAEGERVVKGQYEGYKSESSVGDSSKIETYFRIILNVDLPQWQGVPFTLEAGKSVGEDNVSITVYFKAKESCVCANTEGAIKPQNKLVFSIQPEAKIALCLYAKRPGFDMDIEHREFSLPYSEADSRLKDAYERLLFDVLRGDQTAFLSSAEVENAWKFITPILQKWVSEEPFIYKNNTRPTL